MATFNKVNVFTKDCLAGAHIFGTHTFKVMLTNTAPTSSSAVKADITEITAANGYAAGGPSSAMTLSTASGVAKVVGVDCVITATGAVGPFRYAVLYNDTQTSPAKPIVGFWDYGSAITLASGDTFTVDFDGTNGILTIT